MEKTIITQLARFDFSEPAALCSIIESRGSTPRKDHPVMLVFKDGRTMGTIGGGGLEFNVIAEASKVLENGEPQLMEFRMNGTDVGSNQSICGGYARVLIEKFTPEGKEFWASVLDTIQSESRAVFITECSLHHPVEIKRKQVRGDDLSHFPEDVQKAIRKAIRKQRSVTRKSPDQVALISCISVYPTLHIFGAGHVGKAVSDLAGFLKMDVKVYDDREELLTRDRLPSADEIIHGTFKEIRKNIRISSDDIILITTRNHAFDLEIIQFALNTPADYIGLMSSGRKWKLISDALAKQGIPAETLSRIYAPTGLDIGSQTVPEIALSIMTEIVHRIRKGGDPAMSMSNNHRSEDL